MDKFESETKREFDGQEEGSITVGSPEEDDDTLGIEEGEMILSRYRFKPQSNLMKECIFISFQGNDAFIFQPLGIQLSESG